jgi:hypothetical protein
MRIQWRLKSTEQENQRAGGGNPLNRAKLQKSAPKPAAPLSNLERSSSRQTVLMFFGAANSVRLPVLSLSKAGQLHPFPAWPRLGGRGLS